MSDITRLQRDAENSRQKFAETLSVFRGRMSAPALAEDVVGHFDREFQILQKLRSANSRHPIIMATAILGAWWLIGRVMADKVPPKRLPARERRPM